ncbi:iroquois-class homeodomain protein IRX-1b [Anguilla rostrata]|uniref:Homeobox domain-containing protein n=1 Tax=Anguilla anguilla TaxID=7936 RepID=A0A9D3M4L1_ANGAN|nr:iroquois-class homeodomain protein IRX-1b [Anguilla anguilla]KAG5842417.1 hypothetical protein ANANG_G00177440 [Anguilla anguilla]
MSLPQLSYPQYLSATQAVHNCDRSGVLSASARGNGSDIGANPSATAAAVTSVLGMYANHYSAHNYSAFLPYTRADLALFSQLGSQYEFKDSPGVHPPSFAAHPSTAFYPYGQYQYGDPSRAKSATRESTSTLKAWLQEHKKNPYPTKGEKIMLAIITKMTLTQVSTWFANARRRLKKENKVTWGRSAEDRDGKIFDSDTEGDVEKNEDDEEIDLESIDIDKVDENSGDQSNEEDDEGRDQLEQGSIDKRASLEPQTHKVFDRSDRKNTGLLSPGGQSSCQLPANKPKIWSLAETATSPDNSVKSVSPSAPASHSSPLVQHPAFLPNHGIYTCQIGKLNSWTNAALFGQNPLLSVKSFLGVNQGHQQPDHHRRKQQTPTTGVTSSATAVHSENCPEDFSPKHIDRQMTDSPTQTLKSSFQLVHDSSRNQQEATQRVLMALSST